MELLVVVRERKEEGWNVLLELLTKVMMPRRRAFLAKEALL